MCHYLGLSGTECGPRLGNDIFFKRARVILIIIKKKKLLVRWSMIDSFRLLLLHACVKTYSLLKLRAKYWNYYRSTINFRSKSEPSLISLCYSEPILQLINIHPIELRQSTIFHIWVMYREIHVCAYTEK